jgi:8-oxo-dGTP diphosphatase
MAGTRISPKRPQSKMAQAPILGAGGIVVRSGDKPLIAVVQRRKDDGWVLPKGKLKREESAVAAAVREVMEETGQDVVVHEFLGAISYWVGRRPKVVQFWRMQAFDRPARKPTKDIKAVKWLPLESAIRKLTDPLERVFLQNMAERSLAMVAPVAEQSALSRPEQALETEPPTPLTLPIAEQSIAANQPFWNESPAVGSMPVEPLPTHQPAISRNPSLESPASANPPLQHALAATSTPPGALEASPQVTFAAVRESAVFLPPTSEPRLNLIRRILHRLRRDGTDMSLFLRWTNGSERRSER